MLVLLTYKGMTKYQSNMNQKYHKNIQFQACFEMIIEIPKGHLIIY